MGRRRSTLAATMRQHSLNPSYKPRQGKDRGPVCVWHGTSLKADVIGQAIMILLMNHDVNGVSAQVLGNVLTSICFSDTIGCFLYLT
jgi:hypothetical protein